MNPTQTDRMVARKGEEIQIHRKRAGVAPTVWDLRAFVRSYVPVEIDGTEIQVGDRLAIVSALEVARQLGGLEPIETDQFIRDGAEGVIKAVDKVRGDGGLPDRFNLRVRGLPG